MKNNQYCDWYISQISKKSDRYGNHLVDLMDNFGVNNLRDIPLNYAKDFYEKLIEEENYAR